MKKFEIGKRTDVDIFNKWFDYCSLKQIPYIIIRNSNKYSKVEWDYINLEPRFDNIFADESVSHSEQLLNIFKKYANEKSRFVVSNVTFVADNIFVENAQQFAEELFDAISKRMQDGKIVE